MRKIIEPVALSRHLEAFQGRVDTLVNKQRIVERSPTEELLNVVRFSLVFYYCTYLA